MTLSVTELTIPEDRLNLAWSMLKISNVFISKSILEISLSFGASSRNFSTKSTVQVRF